jgi:hypothetical protein
VVSFENYLLEEEARRFSAPPTVRALYSLRGPPCFFIGNLETNWHGGDENSLRLWQKQNKVPKFYRHNNVNIFYVYKQSILTSLKISASLPLIEIYQMIPLSARSISLDSTFKEWLVYVDSL